MIPFPHLLTFLGVTLPLPPAATTEWTIDSVLRGAATAEVRWPDPLAEVEWRADLGQALTLARRQDRPLFVTVRCPPCKQCSGFDQDVLEGGPELDPLLAQFVTVRLTNARDVDLRLLPMEGFQDLDLSWWGWFLSPEGRTYGVFGGKDHLSDTTRISVPALQATLRRVLDHHYHPDRSDWDVDGSAPELDAATRKTPAELPGFAAWARHGAPEAEPGACLHCHQVADIYRQPSIDAGTFRKPEDLYVWPFPENVGITVDRDHGLRVSKVSPGGSGDRAGIRPGDVLAAAGDRRLFGQADFRGVLHRLPGEAESVSVWWFSGKDIHSGTLELRDGWRESEILWRASISGGTIGAHPGFWPLRVTDGDRRRLSIPRGSLAVRPHYGRNTDRPARRAGLTEDFVIVAVNGERPDYDGREFMSWFRIHIDAGEEVVYTALDGRGRKRSIRFTPTADPD